MGYLVYLSQAELSWVSDQGLKPSLPSSQEAGLSPGQSQDSDIAVSCSHNMGLCQHQTLDIWLVCVSYWANHSCLNVPVAIGPFPCSVLKKSRIVQSGISIKTMCMLKPSILSYRLNIQTKLKAASSPLISSQMKSYLLNRTSLLVLAHISGTPRDRWARISWRVQNNKGGKLAGNALCFAHSSLHHSVSSLLPFLLFLYGSKSWE